MGLSDVNVMPIEEHFEEDCGQWLRSYERQGEDTARKHWSPTEQGLHTCTSKPVFWAVKRIVWGFFRLREKKIYALGMEENGKINFYKLKFSVASVRKVYITHLCPTFSKIVLATAMDKPLRVSSSLTNYNAVCH